MLDHQVADRGFVAGDAYSIADIATYPWVMPYKKQGQNLDDYPHLKRWFEAIASRPATVRDYEKAKTRMSQPAVREEGKKILFGQTAANVKR